MAPPRLTTSTLSFYVVPPNVCITYYSRTGHTRRVADKVAERFPTVTINRIQPEVERRYTNWLFRSAIPESTVRIEPIQTDLREYDAIFLGTPKWTVSCPPFTEFLQRASLKNLPTGVFLTYGGFDERRYLRRIVSKLRDNGADVRATLRIQRDSIETAECDVGVSQFCNYVVPCDIDL